MQQEDKDINLRRRQGSQDYSHGQYLRIRFWRLLGLVMVEGAASIFVSTVAIYKYIPTQSIFRVRCFWPKFRVSLDQISTSAPRAYLECLWLHVNVFLQVCRRRGADFGETAGGEWKRRSCMFRLRTWLRHVRTTAFWSRRAELATEVVGVVASGCHCDAIVKGGAAPAQGAKGLVIVTSGWSSLPNPLTRSTSSGDLRVALAFNLVE